MCFRRKEKKPEPVKEQMPEKEQAPAPEPVPEQEPVPERTQAQMQGPKSEPESTPRKEHAKEMKPGQTATVTGAYEIFDQKGQNTHVERAIVAGRPLPPTPEKGEGFVLEDPNKR